ncbi:MAG: 16S rRNA (uracil(1498)-N(3))-methyltransferase [Desulfobacterales bacterium]|nr:16S rRNA (uracil(1498)-N(3))-methyltransferase [Desulfobacterales bacterium]
MNIILLHETDFINSKTVILKDRRKNHIINVLKSQKTDTLFCGLINNNMGKGIISKIDSSKVELKVNLNQPPPPPLPLTLILALPRPKMLKRIIESSATLGVKKIYLINSWRVEKSFWQSPVLNDEILQDILISGLEQAKDTVLPQIFKKQLFTPFVKQELTDISKNSLCITAHPKTTNSCPQNVNQQTTLAIGPEGGFIDKEIETLEQIGFKTVNLGSRILRTETAVPVLISRLFPDLFVS